MLIVTLLCQTRYYAPRYVSPIPRAHHASIQANPALHQWQDKFGAAIRCLPRERGTDSIEVYSSSAVLPALEPILKVSRQGNLQSRMGGVALNAFFLDSLLSLLKD